MDNYITFDIETTGLRVAEGSSKGNTITCICAKDNKGNYFSKTEDTEKNIIEEFLCWIDEHDDEYILVSANGKDFDIPFLLMRAYVRDISFALSFELIRREHFDIINDITSKKISLNDLAKLYGFEQKSGDGLKAIQLAKEHKWDELMEYCKDDVKLTEKIYLKYKTNEIQ